MDVVLVSAGREVSCWTVVLPARPDLAYVDALARLQLAAKQAGCAIRLRGATVELVDLLDLVGLRVEMDGQPEHREQGRVDEVVVTDDPVA